MVYIQQSLIAKNLRKKYLNGGRINKNYAQYRIGKMVGEVQTSTFYSAECVLHSAFFN